MLISGDQLHEGKAVPGDTEQHLTGGQRQGHLKYQQRVNATQASVRGVGKAHILDSSAQLRCSLLQLQEEKTVQRVVSEQKLERRHKVI